MLGRLCSLKQPKRSWRWQDALMLLMGNVVLMTRKLLNVY